MASESSALVIKINGDLGNFNSALNTAGDKVKNLDSSLTKVAAVSAAAFAGLTATIVGSISAYRGQEQAEIKTRQTIQATGSAAGVTADEIFKMADALEAVTAFDGEDILGGQNLLLTFKNIGSDIFPRVTEAMLDMSATMGTDLKGSAIQLGKALNDPIAGIAALNRIGVGFTETQKKQISEMQKMGDVAGAQKVILKEIEGQMKGLARSTAEGTGVFLQLQHAMGGVAEDIGRELAPTLIALGHAAKNGLKWVRDHPEIAKMAAELLGVGVIFTGLAATVATAGVAILKVSAIVGALSAAFLPATFAASGFWVAVTGPIGIAVAGIAAATAAVAGLYVALKDSGAPKNLDEINKQLEFQKAKLKEINADNEKRGKLGWALRNEEKRRAEERIAELEKLKQASGETENKIQSDKDAALAAEKNRNQERKAEEDKVRQVEIDAQNQKNQKIRDEIKVREMLSKEESSKELEQVRDQGATLTAEHLKIQQERAEAIKVKDDEERALRLEKLQLEQDMVLEKMQENNNKRVELEAEFREQDAVLQEELNELSAEERAALSEQDIEQLRTEIETRREVEADAAKKKIQDKRKSDKDLEAEYKKHGMIVAEINRIMHSEIYRGTSQAFGELAQLTQSSNNKLKSIGKVAAVANIVIRTAESAMNIYNGFSTIPIIGPVLGIAGAAAAVAFGAEQVSNVNKAEKGLLVRGGIPGVDSVPVLAQQGEIIAPTQNFEEVIGSVRAKREAERMMGSDQTFRRPDFDESSIPRAEVILTLADGAFDIIEAKRQGDIAIGVRRR